MPPLRQVGRTVLKLQSVAVPLHGPAAVGAGPGRQVEAVRRLIAKLEVLAPGAEIVGRQGIDRGDSQEECQQKEAPVDSRYIPEHTGSTQPPGDLTGPEKLLLPTIGLDQFQFGGDAVCDRLGRGFAIGFFDMGPD